IKGAEEAIELEVQAGQRAAAAEAGAARRADKATALGGGPPREGGGVPPGGGGGGLPPGSGGARGGGPPKGGGSPQTFSFGRLEAEGWTPPKVVSNRHGQLTNGRYVLDEVGMRPHTSGSTAHGKSQFFYRVNEKELALDAAAYADEAGLWVGNKAKIVL